MRTRSRTLFGLALMAAACGAEDSSELGLDDFDRPRPERDGLPAWGRQTEVVPSGQPGGSFGAAVAIDGDRLLVGAPAAGRLDGGVWMFSNQRGHWLEEARLACDESDGTHVCGYAVALDGRVAVAGALGAASVFEADEHGGWSLAATLTAGPSPARERFGASVAVWGDMVVVGAPCRGMEDRSCTGKAYVFQRAGRSTRWILRGLLQPADGAVSFGTDVAIEGAVVVVGARQGGAHVFVRTLTGWTLDQVLESGTDVEIAGGIIAVAAGGAADCAVGSVAIYGRAREHWFVRDQIAQEDPDGSIAIAFSGDTLVVDDLVLARIDGTWTAVARIPAADAVDLSGDTLVAGGHGSASVIEAY